MVHILCLETATTNCSVGVFANGERLSIIERAEKSYSHSENLHSFIEQAMEEADIGFGDLNAIAVSKGPGSYTGLRIGVSAAKGLCFSLDLPLIAIPTLDVLARKASVKKGLIIPMLDARRMEVYSAVFDSNHKQISDTNAMIIDAHSFAEYFDKGLVYFLGNSNEKCRTVVTHRNAVFNTEVELPSAREMGILTYKKYLDKDFEDLAYFEPYYLKDFVAAKPKK